MVIASHGVFATYGFWPPNDPRGSWSDTVWATHLQRLGETKKVSTRDRRQRDTVAAAIGEIAASLHLKIYALAVLPDHVHFVPARHREDIETLVGFLKRAASRALAKADLHPMRGFRFQDGSYPSPWVRGGWKRFLNTPPEIAGAIDYVRGNPHCANLPEQRYEFETPFIWYRA